MNDKRNRFLIDKKLQWQLARRHILSWLLGGLMILTMPVAVNFLYGVYFSSLTFQDVCGKLLTSIWYPFLIALLLVPMGIQESIRFSNRIAGPVYRIRIELEKLLNGKPASQICVRQKDCLKDFVDAFNKLSKQVNRLQEELAETKGVHSSARDAKPYGCPPEPADAVI